jgi:hypothetical protein
MTDTGGTTGTSGTTGGTIPYLERLEADLEVVAEDAAAHRKVLPGPSAPRRRRRDLGAWKAWAGAAAALLVVAWGIGSLSGSMSANDEARPASGFSQVGSAVSGNGAATGAPDRALDPQHGGAPAWEAADGSNNSTVGDLAGGETAAPSPAPDAPGQAAAIDLAKIDRDGALTLKLPEGSFKDTFAEVIGIAEENGGGLLASETNGPDTGTLTLRIPADNFDRTFTAVSRLGAIRESRVTGKDVTSEYLDLRAHLKIAKARRDVLFGLYDQTTTISSTLQVYKELEDVQLRIEDIQGELNYLDAQTSFSTLKVTLSEREPEQAAQTQEPEVDKPSLTRAFDHAVQGFLGVVAAVVIGLGYLIPLGILAGIGALIVMLVRRRGPAAS